MSFNDKDIVDLYKLVYDNLDYCAIREQISYKLMTSFINDNAKIYQSFDLLPLFIRNNFEFKPKQNSKTLLIAGSATWNNLDMLSDEAGTLNEYKGILSNLTRFLEIKKCEGYKIKFLYGALAHPSKDDQIFMNYLKENDPELIEFVEAKSAEEWLEVIYNASLLISGRFHHSIAAFCLEHLL